MRLRLGQRLLALMLLATLMIGTTACMGPQRRGGEPEQEEKKDKKEDKEKEKEKDEGDKEKEGDGGEKEKSDKEEK